MIEQDPLWQRLEAFPLDDPESLFPFSARLAKEQGWSQAFAAGVCLEYKRFLFLGMRAGHPVSPSPAVDEAWHLHLLYTRSYWDDLCRDLLGKPFHHLPSQGGFDEQEKFASWYENTLQSYQRIFGERAPETIWPVKNETALGMKVNPQQVWILPKPRWFSR